VATRRSGLGRGLGALIPGSDPVETKEEVVDLREDVLREVPIDSVRPNAFQPRTVFDEAALRPLADSIKELGVLQPLLVRVDGAPDKYELIAGERRLRASKLAGLKYVPVIVKKVEDLQSLQKALVENLHRKDLNAIDEASAYRQLIDDFSMTHDDVAKKVGKSRTAVTNMLRLLSLDPKVQKLLVEDKMSEGHARALLAVDDKKHQVQLAERAVRDGMTVRAVEEEARERHDLEKPQTSKKAKSALKSSTPAAILESQERLRNALDTRVLITPTKKNGKITIEYADLQDLGRIAEIIEAGSDYEPEAG
jgi:ParB family transcriptional regulator, chromosome partitioning protein